MRRHATTGLAFCFTLALSIPAIAQGGQGGGASATKGAAATKDAAASTAPRGKTSNAVAAPPASGSAAASPTSPAPASTSGSAAQSAGTAPTTAGPSAVPSVGAGAAAAGGAGMDGATYAVRLRDLESRVDELKDQIRRSHTRLALLSDTILSGGAAGSRADVSFRNEMSSAFRLVRLLVVMDGAVQFNRQDETGALADQKEIPIFTGSVPPGDHTVQVSITLQGNGYGVFTYLRGYKWEFKNSHSFTAVEGKVLNLSMIALERGGVTTPLDQRPGLEWREKVQAITAANAPQSQQGGSTQGSAPESAAPTIPVSGAASGNVSIGGGKK